MKYFFLILILFSTQLFSQSNFKKGEVVLSTGVRKEGFINHSGWIATPDRIEFKNSKESSEIEIFVPSDLQEFYVADDRYIQKTLDVDATDQSLRNLSNKIRQKSETKTIFLRTIVKGKVDLLIYRDGKTHYFASKDDETIELLQLKRLSNSSISNYNKYIGQLNILLGDCLDEKNINKVRYGISHLKKIIDQYNTCSEGKSDFVVQKSRFKSELLLTAGIKQTAYESLYRDYDWDNAKGSSASFGIALNIGFLRNSKKLTLYNELVYQKYKLNTSFRDQRLEQQYSDFVLNIDLGYIELANLIRYNLNNDNEKWNPFLHVGMINAVRVSDKSSETVNSVFFGSENSRTLNPLNGDIVSHRLFFSVGGGLRFRNLSFELRYNFNPEIAEFPTRAKSEIINLILAYKIL